MKLDWRQTPPFYTHSCDACADCVWLGRESWFDLYVCTSEARGTVLVVRFGDRPNDYATLRADWIGGRVPSELVSAPFDTAYERAKRAGVIT